MVASTECVAGLAWEILWHLDTWIGSCTAVALPGSGSQVPDAVLHRLEAGEADVARRLSGLRQEQFVGGRLALRAAARRLGLQLPAVLPGPGGRPTAPDGVDVSVAHKRRIAVGLVGQGPGAVGVDVETLGRSRATIASRILRSEEYRELEQAGAIAEWPLILERFALKEALYKALYPFVTRHVAFREVAVRPGPAPEREARFVLHLASGEGPFRVRGRHEWRGDLLLATVHVEENR